MQWPKEILDNFARALDIEPAEGLDKVTILREMLDETARLAVARVKGDASRAGPSLRTPMTPLGSVINSGICGMARRLSLGGPEWGNAVDAFHTYVEENAVEVFAAFPEAALPDSPVAARVPEAFF